MIINGKKTESPGQKRKRLLRLLVCLLYCAAVFLPLGAVQQSAGAAGFASGELGTIKFIEWTKVEYGSEEAFPIGNDAQKGGSGAYYMFLVWWDYYANDYRVFWGANGHNSHSVSGLLYSSNDFLQRYFRIDSTSFLTSNAHGMPRIYYDGDDGGNKNSSGRGWHRYKIKLNEGNGDWIGADDDYGDSMDFGYESSWGFAVNGCGGNYADSAKKNGGNVCIYYNYSGRRDPGFMWNKSGNCYAAQDKDYGDFDGFSLWIGKEVVYSALDKDYTVTAGNVLNVDGYVIITDDVKLTIEPGAVCSIEGNMINNGVIDCYGTLIVQEQACLCPFDSEGTYSGRVNLYGNTVSYTASDGGKTPGEGSMLVMKDGKFATDTVTYGQLYSNGGSLINYGFMSIPGSLTLIDSYFENRGNLLIGYQVNGLNALKNSTVSGSGVGLKLSGGAYIASRRSCTVTISGNSAVDNYGNIRSSKDFKDNITDCGGKYGVE